MKMSIETYLPTNGRPAESFRKRAWRTGRKIILYGLGATMAYQLILNYSVGNPYASAMLYGGTCLEGLKPSGAQANSLDRTLGCYNFSVALAVGGATKGFFETPMERVLKQLPREGESSRKGHVHQF
jgi:hypothetical protein